MGDAAKALDLHVAIIGAEPDIWRDLRVPATARLNDLHQVIQRAFGWQGYHLHMFTAVDSAGTKRNFSGNDETAMEIGTELDTAVTLEEVLGEGVTLSYEYDFGDSWDHAITMTGSALAPAGEFSLLTGVSRGPVEDSGGIGGYAELCGILTDKSHPEYAEKADWYSFVTGEPAAGFDPDAFDADAVTASLDRLNFRLNEATPTLEELAVVVCPVKWLLQRVGTDGLELTKDGYLKPAVVAEVMTELGWEGRWYGKFNRETQTLPVWELRTRVQEWGLLRKYKGKLVRTPAGRKTYDDDAALWNHLAGRLGHPENRALELTSRLIVDWMLEAKVATLDVRAELLVEALNGSGFQQPDGSPVLPVDGEELYLEVRRSLDILEIFDGVRDLVGPQVPSRAGMKFLLEVQRCQREG